MKRLKINIKCIINMKELREYIGDKQKMGSLMDWVSCSEMSKEWMQSGKKENIMV